MLSPPAGGDAAAPTFGRPPPTGSGGDRAAGGAGAERVTFAERVGDVKHNVERARAEYRSRAAGALGAPPSSGPSVILASSHQRFSDLEAAWGEVMDYTKIDPFSTATPGVNAASAALSRNRRGLDEQVDNIIADLWDGVSSGQARTMTDSRKDDMMQEILRVPGGMQLSPKRGGFDQRQGYAPGMGGDPYSAAGLGLALQLPSPGRPEPQAWPQDRQQLEAYPPPAGAQDFETRRQLEILRGDIMRLEEQVMVAVEAEESELPPPPPLVQKHAGGLACMNRASAYEDIVRRIKISEVGCEGDSGGTSCNSIDDPSVPLMMPPKGGMKIRQQLEALQRECQELKETAVQEVGGESAARRMREMQESVKKTKEGRQRRN